MRNCALCQSNNIKEVKVGETTLLECGECTVRFLEDIPAYEDLNKYYEQSYFLNRDEGFVAERRRIFRLPEQLKLVKELENYIKPGSSILDIGCDKGFFLDEARRYGYKVAGVEPSIVGNEYCSAIGLKIYKDLDLVDQTYDAVVMWHSLEHINDPISFLNKIKSKINPGGYIFIRVPDAASFWSKTLKDRWVWFQPENHYFHYGIKSLSKTVKIAGFELIKIISQKPNDSLTNASFSLSNKIFERNWKAGLSLRAKASKIYQNIVGVELFCIAKKI